MRPQKLTLAGFRSHQNPTTFDFRDRTLLAIVGPTGAGKSSILDGIAYALYGRTPSEARSVKRLICSRSDEARVQLEFSVDGTTYEVTRSLRRKAGPAPHVLIDASSGEVVNGEAAVTARVTELLGLDFSAFCSSVLLAQGEFAQFLRSTPKVRNGILKGVFRLEQIDALRDAAKRRSDELEGDLREIEGERKTIPDDIADLIGRAAEQRTEALARADRLQVALPAERDIEAARDDATERSTRAGRDLASISEAIDKVPAPEKLAELAAQEAEVRALADEATRACEGARASLNAAEDELKALVDELGDESTLLDARAAARSTIKLKAELEALAARRDEAEAAAAGARTDLATVTAEHEDAAKALARAAERRAAAETEHRAHALRSELSIGEACPVCEQQVTALPRGRAPAALKEVRAEEKRASEKEAAARDAMGDARTRSETCTTRLGDLGDELERRTVEFEAAAAELTRYGTDDPTAEIEARLARVRAASRAITEAREVCDSADAARASQGELLGRFEDVRRGVAAALIEVSGRAGVTAPRVDAPMSELVTSGAAIGSALEVARAAADKVVAEASDAATIARERLAELRSGLGVDDDVSIAAALASSRATAEVADLQHSELTKKQIRAGELDDQSAGLAKRRGLFRKLHADLGERRFVAFLLEERTRLLLDLASERLLAMTSRYRLEIEDTDMEVIDELDGEKRRSVGTLSGGETFLASLALALALAELVTRSGGRLQCFFLDEGFGSLDPQSFDLAMDGIERIVGGDRLIGLVSHVHALAERVADRIELERGPEGMTRVLAGAAL